MYNKISLYNYFVLSLTLVFTDGHAEESLYLILSPSLPPPHNTVIDLIKEGIVQHLGQKYDEYLVDISDGTLKKESIIQQKYQHVVAITSPMRAVYQNQKLKGDLYIGAIAEPPSHNTSTGISIYIDPKHYFSRLKTIAPYITRVRAIFHAKHGIHRQYAENIAKEFGIELLSMHTNNLRDAVKLSKKIIDETEPKNDAIWITRDVLQFNHELLLSLFIEETWNKRIISMSTSPIDVKRGILFSLYPDYYELGKQLASLIKDKSNHAKTVKYLKKPQLALNMRTAKHLNLNVDSKLTTSLDAIFPSQ